MPINKKKVATSATAIGLAGLLLLGGSFAWQSISQTALNEASDVINPGGRLHDDFNGENKDVYVENFANENIYARIRLDEYFKIIQNKGTPAEKVDEIAGTMDTDTGEITSWATHYFDSANATDEYWEWLTGGSTIYMPTFNKNKDSLLADINGTYNGNDGVVTDEADDDRYEDYVEYADGEAVTADAEYDADSNDIDDDNVEIVSEEHIATSTLDATLMSMQEWIDAGSQPGEYWVYDTDGWVYWAQAIEPDTATGLLLDGIGLTQVMDDSWYYAINVVAQFITADDLGKADNTGFYSDGETVSDDALTLLEMIGVDTGDEASDDGDDDSVVNKLVLNFDETAKVYVDYGEKIALSVDPQEEIELGYSADFSSVELYDDDEQLSNEQYTYDSETQTVVILDNTISTIKVYDGSKMFAGHIVQYDKDNTAEKEERTFDMYPTYAEEGEVPVHFTIEDGDEIYLWDDEEYMANCWYTISLNGVDSVEWSYTENEPCDPSFWVAADGSSVEFYSSDSGSVTIKAFVNGFTYEMTINLCDSYLKTNDSKYTNVSYIYTGTENELVLDYATGFELISTGHQNGTYISGNTLYVDENETVTPVIKATTIYGEIVYDELIMRGADDKWMILVDEKWEVDPDFSERLSGDDEIYVYYEGETAYSRLNEADEYSEFVTGPSLDEWKNVEFTLYANTMQDGTGESKSFDLTVFMPY